jgi:predicted short-subunit dehydrogenase-like oxidoreductase (DUF2520 family)
LLHTSGAVPSVEVLETRPRRPLGRGLLHPLASFAHGERPASDVLGGVHFVVEGDEAGLSAARRLTVQLGAAPDAVVELEGEALGRYHAAAALAGNYTLALVDAAMELLLGLGVPRPVATRALSGLFTSAARNLEALGLPEAMSGPIVRGDVRTVERHLNALGERPEALALYRAVARRAIDVAARKGRAQEGDLARIKRLLGK